MNSQFYDSKTAFSQSYLLGRIVRNAQRAQKIPFFVRENGLNTLWWTEPFSIILQISRSEIFPSPLRGEGEDEGFSEEAPLTPSLSRERERVTTDSCVEALLQYF